MLDRWRVTNLVFGTLEVKCARKALSSGETFTIEGELPEEVRALRGERKVWIERLPEETASPVSVPDKLQETERKRKTRISE